MKGTDLLASFAASVFLPGAALAGTLETVEGNAYTGVVVAVDDTSATFLWQRTKDQPEDVTKKEADKLFKNQGNEAVVQPVPLGRIAKIDGLPLDAWRSVFEGNLFYRAFANLDAARIHAGTSGDFMKQVKGIVVFLVFLLVVVPLLLVVAVLPFPGEKLSFGYAVGMTFLLTVMGFAGGMLGRVLAANVGFAAHAGAQMGISALVALVMALIVNGVTRYTFVQGIVFTVVWGVAFFLSGHAVQWMIGGLPSAPPV